MAQARDTALSAAEVATLQGLLAKVGGGGGDLPWPLFRFVTEVAAVSNVDLLVRDDDRGVLLAWRDDPFGTGWHVPGSIIRHREEIAHRIAACAREEFGCEVAVADAVAAVIQIFDDRGHSVSLCYPARLRAEPGRRVLAAGEVPQAGDLRWFAACPDQLYPSHAVYREVLEALGSGTLGPGARLFTQHAGRRDAAAASRQGWISPDAALA